MMSNNGSHEARLTFCGSLPPPCTHVSAISFSMTGKRGAACWRNGRKSSKVLAVIVAPGKVLAREAKSASTVDALGGPALSPSQSNTIAWDVPGRMTASSKLMPPYPRGCHIAGMLAFETGSSHKKARGTLGGVEPPFTPIETAPTPFARRRGMADRVVPGTSR